MKKIKLTQGKFVLVDDKDFKWLNQWKWYFNSGYAVRGFPKRILMHRVILNTPKDKVSDHINRNKLDNRRCNLRIATKSLNNFNTKVRIDNKSGVKGIYWSKEHKKWRPSISKDGKKIYFGLFSKLKDATLKRKEMEKKYYEI